MTYDPEPTHPVWLRFTLRDLDGKLIRKVNEVPGNQLVADEDFIFRGDQPLAKVGSADVLAGMHLSLDHLGSVRMTTNGTGAVVAKKKFYPFGEEATPYFEQSAIALKYTGHERDAYDPAATGDDRDYMHARFRSPLTGRFLSVDSGTPTSRRPQTWNRYSYTAGNPMTRTDPDGRNWFFVNDAWRWRKGSSATFTVNGRRQTLTSAYTHLLVAQATGTNKSGGTNFRLTLFNQNQVAKAGTAFSGGGGLPRTPAGNYTIQGGIKDPVGPTHVNPSSPDHNPPPHYGMQVIGSQALPDPATGSLYDVQAAYGSLRAHLNPWAGADAPLSARGNYYHGQAPDREGSGTTHGCLCYGQDRSIIDYLWDLGAAVPVGVDVPLETP